MTFTSLYRLIDFIYPYKGAEGSFSTEPKSFFYDWLYVNAVSQDDSIMRSLVEYDAFTDIEFNPKKSFSCQARSAAILVSIYRKGILERCLESPELFMSEVYSRPKRKVQTVLDCV